MWQEIGVDRMVLIINTGEVIPQERVLRSMHLFAEQVLPAFDKEASITLVTSPATELVEPAMP